ncbi:MAG: septum formation protein Maf [Clostridia bacterium]|nr:septum formation protein Maf [Clostridia bacterium]
MNTIVILASASPRRRELLSQIVDEFKVVSPDADETLDTLDPVEAVLTLSRRKAAWVDEVGVIVAADTVVYDGEILGKPKDEDDAIKTLLRLSGKAHEVYTGVTVRCGEKSKTFYDESKVFFKTLNTSDAYDYVRKFRPLDKAGSYGIQDGVVVEKIEGSYSNVVGLPVEKLKEALKEFNVDAR